MTTYLLAYKGGKMAESEAEQQEIMAAWGAWFGSLGEAVADPGNPFAGSMTVNGEGASEGGSAGLGGYSVLQAESLADAAELAKGCPLVGAGGSVDVYETIAM